MKTEIAITGVGLISPVGHSALGCMHAVRTGLSGLSLLGLPDRVKNWIAGGKIAQWTRYGGHRHWEMLGADAMGQAWRQAQRRGALAHDAKVAMVIGRPEPHRPSPVFPQAGFDAFGWAGQVLGRAPAHVEFVQAGACNAQAGLRLAARHFAQGTASACLIGAIDSQAQLRVTRWHEEQLRLKCSYVTDGLMPSEAAAFLMVEPLDTAQQRGAHVLAKLDAVVGAIEEATVLSDKPNTALALTHAADSALALAQLDIESLGMVWSDLNGESYKAREWAYAAVRLGLRDHTTLMHPADCHGDLGAATDTHLLGLAAMAQATGWSRRPMLVFAGSEAGVRAATVLRAPDAATGVVEVSGERPRVLSDRFVLDDAPAEPEDFRETPDPPKAWFIWQQRHTHQDDIAALYYQRRAMLADPSVEWPRLMEPEARLMRHLDAIVAGGPEAMAWHAAGLQSDEEGVAFGASFMAGHLPAPENLARVAQALRNTQGPALEGLMQGLAHAPRSADLEATLARQWLSDEHPHLRASALRVLSRHRVATPAPSSVERDLAHPVTALELARAAWRLNWSTLAGQLKNLLSHELPAVRREALIAMTCFVPDRAAMFCRSRLADNASFDGALTACLAVCGQLDDAPALLQHLAQHPGDVAAISALGALGNAMALEALAALCQSEDPLVAAAAAAAARLITGSDEPPPARHADDTDTRWRLGRPFAPAACVEELAAPTTALADRMRAQHELARWAGTKTAYEPDAFAVIQHEALQALRG